MTENIKKMTENIKEKFLEQANKFLSIMHSISDRSEQEAESDSEIALLLYEQPDGLEKSALVENIDNLEKLYDVIQFQTEAMSEFIRYVTGPMVGHLEHPKEEEADEDLLPMFMFLQDKSIKLHNQLDFFFSNFEEEDLKKGFSIARRSAEKLKFKKSGQRDQVTSFVKSLRSRTLAYLQDVNELHNWLHGMLDIIDAELQTKGLHD